MQVEVNVQIKPDWVADFAQSSGKGKSSEEISPIATLISRETWHHWFHRWLELLEPDHSPIQAYELTLRLTDNEEIQALNATYRHQDQPTDVLAFAALETKTVPTEIWEALPVDLGDIVISLETALSQAAKHHHSPQFELAWLATHGLLHLLGWDHPDQASLNQMVLQQKHLVGTIGLTASLDCIP